VGFLRREYLKALGLRQQYAITPLKYKTAIRYPWKSIGIVSFRSVACRNQLIFRVRAQRMIQCFAPLARQVLEPVRSGVAKLNSIYSLGSDSRKMLISAGAAEMTITADSVRNIFKGLEDADGASFFEHVADDVDWTVMGTHPLAGHYLSKGTFINGTFDKLSQVLPRGAQLHVENLIVAGDQAVVELRSLAIAKNGMRFDNRYCWVVYFRNALIIRVRAYLDSSMVARLFIENPLGA
jgi:uncharacterized protein